MLLPLLLNLGFAAGVVVAPTPIPPFGDSDRKVRYPNIEDDLEKIRRIRIEIEDSEIIAIVELTLRNFII